MTKLAFPWTRTGVLTALTGLVAAWFAHGSLRYSPRVAIPGESWPVRLVFSRDFHPNWLKPFLIKFGVSENNPALVIYDLTAGQEIAYADLAHFSHDCKTLAVTTENSVELYDLPLRKPWGKIVGIALICASIVFLAGKWIRWRRRKHISPETSPCQDAPP